MTKKTFCSPVLRWRVALIAALACTFAVRSVEADGIPTPPMPHASLTIKGSVTLPDDKGPVHVDSELLAEMPLHRVYTSTAVTDGVIRFDGVLLRDLLERFAPYGEVAIAKALNDYEVAIPVKDFVDFDVLLAWAADGELLADDDKGPFWIVYPRDQHVRLQDIRYDYRWVWQLHTLLIK